MPLATIVSKICLRYGSTVSPHRVVTFGGLCRCLLREDGRDRIPAGRILRCVEVVLWLGRPHGMANTSASRWRERYIVVRNRLIMVRRLAVVRDESTPSVLPGVELNIGNRWRWVRTRGRLLSMPCRWHSRKLEAICWWRDTSCYARCTFACTRRSAACTAATVAAADAQARSEPAV